jgi:hypothetical protein
MVKILMGLVAAIVIAVGGFFGFEFYMQHRIAGEVEAAFEQIRATGGKASHGKVSFDLLNRTVTVADLTAQTAAQPPVSLKIGSLTASGVKQPDAARLSADNIEITDVEVGLEMPAETLLNVTYKAPRISVRDYSGPASAPRLPASSSLIDLYRVGFELIANMTAASVTTPSLTGTMNFSAAVQGGAGSGEFTYSGFTMEGLKEGRIATMKASEAIFRFVQPAGMTKTITGSLTDFAAYDTDFNVMAAIFDPQKANDDQYYRAYRQISTGAYTIKFDQLLNVRIEGFTVDDVAMRPSRLQLPALMAMTPPTGATPPTPAQVRAMLDKAAGVYEGVRIGNAEMRGLSMETPQGPFKLAAMRFNLENGKIGEFAFEGLDAHSPNGPVKVGRFALKSIDIANLMRMSALFLNPSQQPPPDKVLGMIPLIEGVEVKGFAAPYKSTGKPINIDTFNLNWGQFIGPIPSKARLTVRMSSPLDVTDFGQQALVAAGVNILRIDSDVGATWTETSRTFALEPVTLDLGGIAKASARVSLANVPREVFSPNAVQAAAMAGQIEAGTIELSLRDTGGVDLLVAQQARTQNVSRDAARRAIVDSIRAGSEQAAATNPDAVAAVEAIARFVESPGQTLNIKLTPLGKVTAEQLMPLLKTDPLVALAQFRIEASTGL